MAYSIRTVSIALSLLVAIGLIAGAFLVSSPPPTVSAENTEELLRAYAEKDTDNDGLPDWQESLYKTDPNNPQSVKAGMTDGEAVEAGLVKPQFESEAIEKPNDADTIPGEAPVASSITEQFSHVLLESIIEQGGGKPLTDADQQALVSFLMNDLSAKIAGVLTSKYAFSSIHQSASADVMTYIGAVENILVAYQPPEDSSDFLMLSQAYVEEGDAAAGPKLKVLARAYGKRAEALLALSVPSSLATAHLELIRSFDTLAKATLAVADYQKDPLPVMGALSLYRPSMQQMGRSFRALGEAVTANGGGAEGTTGHVILWATSFAP